MGISSRYKWLRRAWRYAKDEGVREKYLGLFGGKRRWLRAMSRAS